MTTLSLLVKGVVVHGENMSVIRHLLGVTGNGGAESTVPDAGEFRLPLKVTRFLDDPAVPEYLKAALTGEPITGRRVYNGSDPEDSGSSRGSGSAPLNGCVLLTVYGKSDSGVVGD